MCKEGLKNIICKQTKKKRTSFPTCFETVTKIDHVLNNINNTLQLVINKNYVCHIF